MSDWIKTKQYIFLTSHNLNIKIQKYWKQNTELWNIQYAKTNQHSLYSLPKKIFKAIDIRKVILHYDKMSVH